MSLNYHDLSDADHTLPQWVSSTILAADEPESADRADRGRRVTAGWRALMEADPHYQSAVQDYVMQLSREMGVDLGSDKWEIEVGRHARLAAEQYWVKTHAADYLPAGHQ